MKSKPSSALERGRIRDGQLGSDPSDGNNGAFILPRKGTTLAVIVSDGRGWDHVSVSTVGRCPTWDEMNFVKRLFFRDDEAVMQLHPPKHLYVNNHPYCLHLWRPQRQHLPLPPAVMVGVVKP